MARSIVRDWPGLMTRDTAAEYLDCSPRKVDQLQALDLLVPVDTHFGKRFPRAELDRYIETRPEWGTSDN